MRLAGAGGSHPYVDVARQSGEGVGPSLCSSPDSISHAAEDTGSAAILTEDLGR
jgi:hypothetical protein